MKNSFISLSSFDIPEYQAPSAWLEHIPFAFELINKLKPKTFVELGVHHGVSYFAICQSVKANSISCTCYGIDSWLGDAHAGYYDDSLFNTVNSYNEQHYASFSHLIKSYFDEAVSRFEDKSIDLLHIDGLHTYEAVKKDFETWKPKLSDSSIVLFHDIAMKDSGFGVYRLWEELSTVYPSFAFNHGWGLGILATGSSIAPDLVPLFKLSEQDSQDLRAYYEKIGRSMSDKFALTEYQEKELRLSEDVRNITAQFEAVKGQLDQQAAILTETQVQLETLKVEKTQKENNIATLLVELQTQREDNANLQADIQKKALVLENYSLQNTQLLKEIEGYKNSTSWKLTRPFRLIKIKIARLLK